MNSLNNRWTRRFTMAAVAAVSFAIVTVSAPAARAAEPIKIGFSMALTGALAGAGKAALVAMEIWREDVNKKGGLLGRQVEFVYYDDATSPSKVPGIYSKLLNVDKVDLIVSGYFYHKRAAEPWCEIVAPSREDWAVVNGTIPDLLVGRRSYAQYLNEVSLEEGLLAELAFRRHHFESMGRWDEEDSRIEVFRYEEILGHEAEVFDRIFRFFELPFSARQIGLHHVRRFRASNRGRRSGHIRDPRSGQWRDHFTPAVTAKFSQEYGDLIDRLGYPAD